MKSITYFHPDVYEPAEDSYLLAEILENENLEGKDVLDIGTGTGILAIIAAKKKANVMASDINNKAIEIAKNNANLNDVRVVFRKSDLFGDIPEKFDLIIFNSPYLPVDDKTNTKSDSLIEKAWNDDGTIAKFFDEVGKHLKDNGKFLILLSSLTKASPQEYAEKFMVKKITSEKLFFEEIFVVEGKMKRGI